MLLGVVLCGGQSKRMGSDKGLLPINSSTWAQFAGDKLKNLGLQVVISINPAQTVSYRNIFSSDKLIVDSVDADGPLRGLLSVHKKLPGKDLLPIACDMIDIDLGTLQEVIDCYYKYPSFDYYVPVVDNFIEPFAGIYPSDTLSTILKKVNAKEMGSYSLTKLIGSSNFKKIDIKTKASFSNYNDRRSIEM